LFYAQDAESRGFLATFPTNTDLLTWSQSQRDASVPCHGPTPDPDPLADSAAVRPSNCHCRWASRSTFLVLRLTSPRDAASGLIIIQDGKVRLERYGLGFGETGRWTSFSVAKSFTSTLVGAAIEDGYIKSLDDKVTQYVPDLRGSAYETSVSVSC
jgi:hypothetical protein